MGKLSNRQLAAINNSHNPNRVVMWRKAFTEGGFTAFHNQSKRHAGMAEESQPPFVSLQYPETEHQGYALSLQEENERLCTELSISRKT